MLRGADAIVYCHDASAPPDALLDVRARGRRGRHREAGAAAGDEARRIGHRWGEALERLRAAAPDLRVVGVSVLDDERLDALRDEVWNLTGLIRVFTRRPGSSEADPLAVRDGATVEDVAAALHGELAEAAAGARIWGDSVRFAGQRVGRDHLVADGDIVEVIA